MNLEKSKGRFKKIEYIVNSNGCYEISVKNKSKYLGNHKYIGTRYPVINRFNKLFQLHRLIFYVFNGYFPTLVMHSCDNPYCINPQHLIPGTPKENSQDASKKGRIAFGIRNKGGGNKLNDSKVKEIKELLSKGNSLINIAQRFKVSKQMIFLIKQGKKWKHIKQAK